jgi:hypothetical protein
MGYFTKCDDLKHFVGSSLAVSRSIGRFQVIIDIVNEFTLSNTFLSLLDVRNHDAQTANNPNRHNETCPTSGASRQAIYAKHHSNIHCRSRRYPKVPEHLVQPDSLRKSRELSQISSRIPSQGLQLRLSPSKRPGGLSTPTIPRQKASSPK